MNTKIDLSIIVISYNTRELTMNCIESVLNQTYGINCEIIVVDNASSDGTKEFLKKLAKSTDNVKIIYNKDNLGFGSANNQGFKLSRGRYILLLNSDTIISSNLLPEMIQWMDRNPEIGISTCSLKNADGTLQGTGGYFPTLMRVFSWMVIQDVPFVDRFIKPFHPMKEKARFSGQGFYLSQKPLDWVTGAFFLINRKVADDIGYFDEDYFMYTEEVDFCYRAKMRGWEVYYHPKWTITHFGGGSGTKEKSVIFEYDGVKMFYKKHYSPWKYQFLRALLKIGSILRIIVFRFTESKKTSEIYVKALKSI